MDITLNGQAETLPEDLTLSELLKEKSLNPQLLAAELNGKILDRGSFDQTSLKQGDILELLQMMGGG